MDKSTRIRVIIVGCFKIAKANLSKNQTPGADCIKFFLLGKEHGVGIGKG